MLGGLGCFRLLSGLNCIKGLQVFGCFNGLGDLGVGFNWQSGLGVLMDWAVWVFQ